jgi:hypothetical protein
MALIFFDSFDHYSSTQFTRKWTSATGNSITSGRTNSGAVTFGTAFLHKTFTSEYPKLVIGTAYRTNGFSNTIVGCYNLRQTGLNSSDGVGITHIGDGRLQFFWKGSPNLFTNPIPNFVMSKDIWYHITLEVVVSRPQSDQGRIDYSLYVNGEFIHSDFLSRSVSGSDELKFASVNLGGPGGGNSAIHDDVWVTDEENLGDIRIYVIRPNASGDASAWSVSGSANNWEAVDDTSPDDESSYIFAPSVGLKELHNMSNITALGPIKGAQFLWNANKDEAGIASYTARIKSEGNELNISTDYPSYVSWTYERIPYLKSPFTNNEWTEYEINTIQMGEARET